MVNTLHLSAITSKRHIPGKVVSLLANDSSRDKRKNFSDRSVAHVSFSEWKRTRRMVNMARGARYNMPLKKRKPENWCSIAYRARTGENFSRKREGSTIAVHEKLGESRNSREPEVHLVRGALIHAVRGNNKESGSATIARRNKMAWSPLETGSRQAALSHYRGPPRFIPSPVYFPSSFTRRRANFLHSPHPPALLSFII